jgi:hypothetical protein
VSIPNLTLDPFGDTTLGNPHAHHAAQRDDKAIVRLGAIGLLRNAALILAAGSKARSTLSDRSRSNLCLHEDAT